MSKFFIQTFPTYEVIFGCTESDVLASILPEQVSVFVKLTSYISSVLYIRHGSTEEEEVVNFFGDVFSNTVDGRKIHTWLASYSNLPLSFINTNAFSFLYEILLERYESGKSKYELTITDKVLYLKLLLIANSKYEQHLKLPDSQTVSDPSYRLYFQKMLWSHILPQYEQRFVIDFAFELCRALAILTYSKEKYSNCVNAFLSERGCNNIHTYAISMISLMLNFHIKRSNDEILCEFDSSNQVDKLLQPFALSLPIAQRSELATHPVVKIDGAFYVLDWNHLAGQICLGTYFGINAKLKEANIVDEHGITPLKGELGNVMEANLLKPIIECVFKRCHQKMKFDCDGGKGLFPDVMIQSGNNVFIIEFKDKLLSERVFKSQCYSDIAEDIEKTFINGKGIEQLLNYTQKYIDGKYEDWFGKYDQSKITHIYPIILYTDYRYGIEGINDYLVTRFEERLNGQGRYVSVSELYKSGLVQPATIISLGFLFKNARLFNSEEIKLHTMLQEYIDTMRKYRQAMDDYKIRSWEEIPNTYKSFESYFSHYDYIYSSWDNLKLILSQSKLVREFVQI